jgi:hypothetical protein
MSQPHPYAGQRQDHLMAPPDPVPNEDATRLRRAEAEVERLRGIVKHQEQALKIAGKVLQPYVSRAMR